MVHPLDTSLQPPARLNNPFCYEPDALCRLAMDALWRHLASEAVPEAFRADIAHGKMFGVLVVEDPSRKGGSPGWLAAFSGQVAGSFRWPFFVPPIVDYLAPDGWFKCHEREIDDLNRRILDQREACSERRRQCQERLEAVTRQADADLSRYRALMVASKERREKERQDGATGAALVRESQFQHAEWRRKKRQWQAAVDAARHELDTIDSHVAALEQERERKSQALQAWLFAQYELLNGRGERRRMDTLFPTVPPSGAGDCCEPKLLQYAYRHGLRPLCMAMRWWGDSPKEEVRHHGQYYPACNRRCKPILGWMTQGLDVEANPLERDGGPVVVTGPGERARKGVLQLRVVYEDNDLCVVDKPAGLLSVPGKGGRTSVLQLMRDRYPGSGSPLVVHRLDMDTSGLMVIAKTMEAYRGLQRQFASHEVRKRYESLNPLTASSPLGDGAAGRHVTVSLPLRPDLDDRPRQLVDRRHGRPAVTECTVLRREGDCLRLSLRPMTGRTHQLRVHCAHHDGLGMPIKGDALYGAKADRLYLHAAEIAFHHPVTGCPMTFRSKPPF